MLCDVNGYFLIETKRDEMLNWFAFLRYALDDTFVTACIELVCKREKQTFMHFISNSEWD